MKSFPAEITDPVYVSPKSYNAYEVFLLKLINDKRDLPFAKLLAAIHLLVIIPAVFLYFNIWSNWSWWLAAIPFFYISQFYFKGRFGLMLHCICHRKLFKKKYSYLNTHAIWVVCPFFGHTPESYFAHHIGMHHMENNMPDDDSSTMAYQRDSIKSFLKYYLDFFFVGFRNTVMYLYYRRRKKMYINLTWGELSFYALCIGLSFVNLSATLLIFIIPFVFARLVMMLGNWAQHAFVDRQNPDDVYTNSIICINTKYNHVCWNDGYHTIHHLRPGMHYTELPTEFLKQKDALAKNRTLVFDGIHYLHIFIYLMTKRYDKLAANLVNMAYTFTNDEEVIALMKERTKRFDIARQKETAVYGIIPTKKLLEKAG
jgi:fatty acid desaturase